MQALNKFARAVAVGVALAAASSALNAETKLEMAGLSAANAGTATTRSTIPSLLPTKSRTKSCSRYRPGRSSTFLWKRTGKCRAVSHSSSAISISRESRNSSSTSPLSTCVKVPMRS